MRFLCSVPAKRIRDFASALGCRGGVKKVYAVGYRVAQPPQPSLWSRIARRSADLISALERLGKTILFRVDPHNFRMYAVNEQLEMRAWASVSLVRARRGPVGRLAAGSRGAGVALALPCPPATT